MEIAESKFNISADRIIQEANRELGYLAASRKMRKGRLEPGHYNAKRDTLKAIKLAEQSKLLFSSAKDDWSLYIAKHTLIYASVLLNYWHPRDRWK